MPPDAVDEQLKWLVSRRWSHQLKKKKKRTHRSLIAWFARRMLWARFNPTSKYSFYQFSSITYEEIEFNLNFYRNFLTRTYNFCRQIYIPPCIWCVLRSNQHIATFHTSLSTFGIFFAHQTDEIQSVIIIILWFLWSGTIHSDYLLLLFPKSNKKKISKSYSKFDQ